MSRRLGRLRKSKPFVWTRHHKRLAAAIIAILAVIGGVALGAVQSIMERANTESYTELSGSTTYVNAEGQVVTTQKSGQPEKGQKTAKNSAPNTGNSTMQPSTSQSGKPASSATSQPSTSDSTDNGTNPQEKPTIALQFMQREYQAANQQQAFNLIISRKGGYASPVDDIKVRSDHDDVSCTTTERNGDIYTLMCSRAKGSTPETGSLTATVSTTNGDNFSVTTDYRIPPVN